MFPLCMKEWEVVREEKCGKNTEVAVVVKAYKSKQKIYCIWIEHKKIQTYNKTNVCISHNLNQYNIKKLMHA